MQFAFGLGAVQGLWTVGDQRRIWWQEACTYVDAQVIDTRCGRVCLAVSYRKDRWVTWLDISQANQLLSPLRAPATSR